MQIKEEVLRIAKQAKQASRQLANLSSKVKDEALLAMAASLESQTEAILSENAKDLEQAKAVNLSSALIDRLKLNEARIKAMASGLRDVVKLTDPIGEVISMWKRPNGLQIGKLRVPLGVVGIIYEARPNVTADAAGLCLKSGNSVLLKGGKEAINSNLIIAKILTEASKPLGIPEGSISFIPFIEREAVYELVRLNEYVDVIILRGGKGMIEGVSSGSTVPIIQHGEGNCHIYIDSIADLAMAEKIVFNAKVQRPGVCNAAEKLLVHQEIARKFLPCIISRLQAAKVEVRGCEQARQIMPNIIAVTPEDWPREYLDLILAVKVVSSLDEAIEHINSYGSSHSEAIVTSSYPHAQRFLQEVDAAAVYVNASTRFTDGGEFGLGSEIGISTQKLHARGPMGLTELTSTKFIILGSGQIRE